MEYKTITQDEFDKVMEKHQQYLKKYAVEGDYEDIRESVEDKLRGTDPSYKADLSWTDLTGLDLKNYEFEQADLSHCYFI